MNSSIAVADVSAAPASTLAADAAPHPRCRRPGRPSAFSMEKLQAVCTFIRRTGLSDTAAGAEAGVKRSTLSRWKHQDEEVELLLDQARALYEGPRLQAVREAR